LPSHPTKEDEVRGLRGHVRQRGRQSWEIVYDVGEVPAVRCSKGHRTWIENGASVETCPRCGDPLGKPRPERRQTSKTFKTRRDAQAALIRVLGAVEDGTWVAPSRETFGDWAPQALAALRSEVRGPTFDFYDRITRQHLVPRLGQVPLQRIAPALLKALYADLLASGRLDGRGGLSARSVQMIHVTAHRLLAMAVEDGRLQRNPAARVEPPRVERQEVAAWDADTLRAFLDFARETEPRLFPAYRLAASTGMRRAEVCGLKKRYLDLDARRLSVIRTLVRTADDGLIEGDPKSVKGRRSIALDARTVVALREHLKRQAEERLAKGPEYQDHGLVFQEPDGRPIDPSRFSKVFARLVRQGGFPPLSVHGLRHTWATLALAAGVHPKVVQERLGHSTVAFTLDRYSHVLAGLQEEAAERVAGLIDGGRRLHGREG
jgi:integrase